MRKCRIKVTREVLEYKECEELVKEGKAKFNMCLMSISNKDEELAKTVLKMSKLDGQELKFHQFITHNNVATAILEDSNMEVHLVRADCIQFITEQD